MVAMGKFARVTKNEQSCEAGTNIALEVSGMNVTATGIGITRLGQVAINIKDVDRATAFYQDKVWLKLFFKAPPGLAFFDCGGVRLMLSRPEKPELDAHSSILYFAVPDIQFAH